MKRKKRIRETFERKKNSYIGMDEIGKEKKRKTRKNRGYRIALMK